MLRDFRFALRSLAKSPGFTTVVVLTLALGIGANTAIFSVVESVLLAPLPFHDPDRLVRVGADLGAQDAKDVPLSIPEIFDVKERSQVFSELSALAAINSNITEIDEPERVQALLTDIEYFSILGVSAQIGRIFQHEDYTTGISTVAVISDSFWRRHWGGDPSAVGKRFRLDNDWYTVIGVAPKGFRHPGRGLLGEVEVWAPAGWKTAPFPNPMPRTSNVLQGAIGRLKPGLSLEEARQRLLTLTNQLRSEYPDIYGKNGWTLRVTPLHEDLVGRVKPALLVLLGAVGFVLLIACANVANLLLARSAARQREVAIRQALGAGRLRLVRQVLAESVCLAFLGGGAGLLLASWGVRLLVKLAPASLPRTTEIGVNGSVLLFTLVTCVLVGLLFGAAPALHASRPHLADTLKDAARGSSAGTAKGHARKLLVVAECALALVLLIGAGLLVRTLSRLQAVDLGFDGSHVLTAGLWLPQPNEPETGPYFSHPARVRFFNEVLRRVSALPGVTTAAVMSRVPLLGGGFIPFEIEGRKGEGPLTTQFTQATPGAFTALAIPLVSGRAFTDADDEKATPVALVNRAFARKLLGGKDPIGLRLHLKGRVPQDCTIVGVVGDVLMDGLDAAPRPLLYRPLSQSSGLSEMLLLKTSADPIALGEAIRREVRAVDRDQPTYGVRTMDEILLEALGPRRFAMILLGLFAGVALLLATVGIYGVMAYSVAQRTHELGIRVALGANAKSVLSLVMGQGAVLTFAGIGAGLLGAAALTRALSPLLFGVSPHDLLTFAGVPLLLAVVALVACAVPALRATRVDPIVALRGE
jgi:putative ABC transport system permease protein